MTKIEWCDYTLNPIVGCAKCSPGCDNCYAEKFAARLAKNPKTAAKYKGVVDGKGRWTGKISGLDLAPFDRLPKKPSRVFVGSMTDLFHGKVSSNYLMKIRQRMIDYPQHDFLILTKRPEGFWRFPPAPNLWLGVTVCNQQEADEKIPILLDAPAAKRFVSVEPMLGPVDVKAYLNGESRLDWIICGGETGKNARPMHPDWVKSLRDQCRLADTPFFFKSWAEWLPVSQMAPDFVAAKYPFGAVKRDGAFVSEAEIAARLPLSAGVCKCGKKASGHLIDGAEWRQFPEA